MTPGRPPHPRRGLIVSAVAAAAIARVVIRGVPASAPPANANDNRFQGVNQTPPLTFTD